MLSRASSRLLLSCPSLSPSPLQLVSLRRFSDSYSPNTTYSGGHASEGQGGFYGSGGHRKLSDPDKQAAHRTGAVASREDVAAMDELIKTVAGMEQELSTLIEKGRIIEIKAKIKKVLTHPNVSARLERLEFKGGMVWGLSVEERQAIEALKEKVKAC